MAGFLCQVDQVLTLAQALIGALQLCIAAHAVGEVVVHLWLASGPAE